MGLISPEEIRAARLGEGAVAVLGYGSQGSAHAMNLRDSGVPVIVGLRPGSQHAAEAQAEGFEVCSPAEAVAQCAVVALLVPDEVQPDVYQSILASSLPRNAMLVFAHGYNIHFGRIRPRHDLDVVLVAPSGIGEQVRARYAAGDGTAGFVAVSQDATGHARSRALAYARALGHGRVAVIETTFAEETESDLFAEQAVLVGGLTELIRAGFETLVEQGYQREIAYFCCLEEVKLMADMIYSEGLARLQERISSTAAFGGLRVGPKIVNERSREAMREALSDIRSGAFAAALGAEVANGSPRLAAALEGARRHPIETVRERLRGLARNAGVGPEDAEVAS